MSVSTWQSMSLGNVVKTAAPLPRVAQTFFKTTLIGGSEKAAKITSSYYG